MTNGAVGGLFGRLALDLGGWENLDSTNLSWIVGMAKFGFDRSQLDFQIQVSLCSLSVGFETVSECSAIRQLAQLNVC